MSETKELEGKVAVVTGGSRGLGSFIARELAAGGARVIVTGRQRETLNQAASRAGENVTGEVCDHADPGSIESFAARTIREYGVPDILVNNAGVVPHGSPVADLDPDAWNRTIATNLTGVFLTTKAFLPGMIDRGSGEIVMIASTSGLRADAGSAAYNASKFGLRGFSEALAKEVRRSNIRVNVICPSSIDLSDPPGAERGEGLHLHGADVASTIRHLVALPGRTLVRELEIWGTNP
jgi:3-oxoacyl-[acyl-carrier protein] reductase